MADNLNFIMNSDKTIQYKFESQQELDNNQDYGYICGGENGSSIERLSFSLDLSGGKHVGNLSENKNDWPEYDSTVYK